jgi:general secretion pathway protein M
MPGPLPPLASRLLALALLVALVAFGWLGGVRPVIARWHDARAQIEQTRELLARYRGISAGRVGLEAELGRWREEVLPKSGVFSGSDPDIVAAELQSAVSGIVKENDGDLLSIQILREPDEGGRQAVAVRVQFTADVEALTSIFHDLESAEPYLFLDNLQIRAGRTARRLRIARIRAQVAAAEVDTLFVTCDVQGYMRSEPPS